MEVVFHFTKQFEKDLLSIGVDKKKLMAEYINRAAESFSNDMATFYKHAFRPHISLRGGLSSSLYVLRVSNFRVICAIDDDPLFSQRIFTLFRIIVKGSKEYYKLVESLYQEDLIEYGNLENGRN